MNEAMNNYTSKAEAGWLGKNIGGTLGGPHEGVTSFMHLNYYHPVPTEPMANDDLDLQLVWLDKMRAKGVLLTPADFADCWKRQVTYHIAEYYMGQRNLLAGVPPPLSGAFNNWWFDGMGCTIRSEIWAMIAPGKPDIAAAYAYLDGSVDHAGDGIYGEMFMAAMQSAAFVESDPHRLIEIGLQYVPADAEIRKVVELVVSQHRAGCDPFRLRNMICVDYVHPADFTFVLGNIGFILLGLLYGRDFGEAICLATNCGYDTDCTAATLGALLGIMHGRGHIEQKWLTPIGDAVLAGWGVREITVPSDIAAMTRQTEQLAQAVDANEDQVRRHLARWTGLSYLRSGGPFVAIPSATLVTLGHAAGLTLRLDYLDTPAVGQGEIKTLELSVENESATERLVEVELALPNGWEPRHPALTAERGVWSLPLSIPAGDERRVRFDCIQAAEGVLSASQQVRFAVLEGGARVLDAAAGLVGKSTWVATRPIAADETEWIAEIEACGALPASGLELRTVEIAGDDLEALHPAPGFVIFAQTEFVAEEPMRVRMLANSTGGIKAYFEGERVINKTHYSEELVPSCHLQVRASTLLPPNGYADLELKQGSNRILLCLVGDTRPLDTNFHLMRLRESAGAEPQIQDFIPLTGVSNVTRLDEVLSGAGKDASGLQA